MKETKVETSEKYNSEILETILRTDAETLKQIVLQVLKERIKSKISDRELERRVADLLQRCGIPTHLSGYNYSIMATVIGARNRIANEPAQTQKQVYALIAEKCDKKESCIERSIRTVVKQLWEHGNLEEIHKIFGRLRLKEGKKPSNRIFIATLVETIVKEI